MSLLRLPFRITSGSRRPPYAERGVPAADVGGQRVGLMRPPRAGGIFLYRRRIVEDRLHHPPRGLDTVLAREQHGVALPRVDEKTLVGIEVFGRRMVHEFELRRFAHHLLARPLDARAERDEDVRAEEIGSA